MFSFVIYSEEPEFAAEIEKQIGASGVARVAAVISSGTPTSHSTLGERP